MSAFGSGFVKVAGANESAMNSLKGFLCPECKRAYDMNLRNGSYIGRVPLILDCKHTICEDCVRSKLCSNQANCPECEEPFNIENEKSLQQAFPVNFYLLGLIYYAKPSMISTMSIDSRSGGFRQGFKPKSSHTTDYPELLMTSSSSVGADSAAEPCCSKDCKKAAQLKCSDCAEAYCEVCCDVVHKMARGLRSHKISPIVVGSIVKEAREVCPEHPNGILEFHCEDCKKDVCCYCLLKSHKAHKFNNFTELGEEQIPEFCDLLKNAEEVLKRLELTQKAVQWNIDQNRPTHNKPSKIENNLCQFFANLHGRLQQLEARLREEAVVLRDFNYYKLCGISKELNSTVRSLRSMVDVGKPLANTKSNEQKINVQSLMEKLRTLVDTPCYLVGQKQSTDAAAFTVGNIFDDLEDHFSISAEANDEFRLVAESQLPEDYQEFEIPDNCSVKSGSTSQISSIDGGAFDNRFSARPTSAASSTSENCLSRTETPSNIAEIWIKKINEHQRNDKPSICSNGCPAENVIVSHINSPHSFYVQLLRNKNNFLRFTSDLAQYARFAKMVQIPELNKIYLVKYDARNSKVYSWNRGRVVEILPNEKTKEITYKVQYIDYGNVQKVKKQNLREIASEFEAPTPYAVHCKIYDIEPKHEVWEPNALTLMTQILNSCDVTMIIYADLPHIMEVDLMVHPADGEGTSLREAMIFTGYGCLVNTDNHVSPVQNEYTSQTILYRNKLELKEGDSHDVILSHVIDPDNIYIQLASNVPHITKLVDQMLKFYENKNKYCVYNPRKDMNVAVKYTQKNSATNNWYRAQILNVLKGKGSLEVFLVDFGQTVTIPWTIIKRLQPQFMTLECQAIRVKLADIAPKDPQSGWSEGAKEVLEKHVLTKDPLKLVVGNEATEPPSVVLFETYPDMDYCINAQLVTANHVNSTGKLSATVMWKRETEEKKPEESFTTSLIKTVQSSSAIQNISMEEEDDDFKNALKKEVNVLKVVNPSEIYVSFTDERLSQFRLKMNKELTEFYSNQHRDKCKPEIGLKCVVLNPLSRKYQRATINSLNDDDSCNVLLTDIHEEAVIPNTKIFVLDQQFKAYPSFVTRCHLSGIHPAGGTNKWSGLATEYLQDLLNAQKSIYITKSGVINKDHSLPVKMWYSEVINMGPLEPSCTKYHSINKGLVKNGLALKERPLELIRTEKVKNKKEDDETRSASDALMKAIASPTLEKRKSQLENDFKDAGSSKTLTVMRVNVEKSGFTEPPMNVVKKPLRKCKSENFCDAVQTEESCSDETVESLVRVGNFLPGECDDYPPAKPITKEKFVGDVTYVDMDGIIHLQDQYFNVAFKEMVTQMKVVFDRIPPEPPGTVFKVGQLCTVFYHEDKCWYRGKVVGTEGKDVYRVRMCDYGNVESVPLAELRKEVMYTDIPSFCQKIRLYRVFPKDNKWVTSDLDRLHNIFATCKVIVMVQEKQKPGKPALADVYTDNRLYVNDYIVKQSPFLSRTPFKNTPTVAIDSDDEDIIIVEEKTVSNDDKVCMESNNSCLNTKHFSADSNQGSDIENSNSDLITSNTGLNEFDSDLKYTLAELNVKENSTVDVAVINFIDYNLVILEIVNDSLETDDFNKISDAMQNSADDQPPLDETDVKVGQPCVCRFTEDQTWYRAKIFKILRPGFVRVLYVDYGNFEDVDVSSLRVIRSDWLAHPLQHYIAEIVNIEVEDVSRKNVIFDFLYQFNSTIQRAVIEGRDPLKVSLINSETGDLLYQNLIDSGLLKLKN